MKVYFLLIALVSSIGFLWINAYPFAQLQINPDWGPGGYAGIFDYGYPLRVCASCSCVSGPTFNYQNLIFNLWIWNVATCALWAVPYARRFPTVIKAFFAFTRDLGGTVLSDRA